MAHEPSRSIGTDFKLALQLERTHLRLACAHHIETYEPLIERNMRIFADRSNCDGEAIKAFCAFVKPGAARR